MVISMYFLLSYMDSYKKSRPSQAFLLTSGERLHFGLCVDFDLVDAKFNE